MRLYRCRLDMRACHPADSFDRASSDWGFHAPPPSVAEAAARCANERQNASGVVIPVRNPPHSFHVLGFDYVISNQRISDHFPSLILILVLVRCVVGFGAQIAPHFLDRDVDPRKDHPKDAWHPQNHTVGIIEISDMIPLWAVGFPISI